MMNGKSMITPITSRSKYWKKVLITFSVTACRCDLYCGDVIFSCVVTVISVLLVHLGTLGEDTPLHECERENNHRQDER